MENKIIQELDKCIGTQNLKIALKSKNIKDVHGALTPSLRNHLHNTHMRTFCADDVYSCMIYALDEDPEILPYLATFTPAMDKNDKLEIIKLAIGEIDDDIVVELCNIFGIIPDK